MRDLEQELKNFLLVTFFMNSHIYQMQLTTQQRHSNLSAPFPPPAVFDVLQPSTCSSSSCMEDLTSTTATTQPV